MPNWYQPVSMFICLEQMEEGAVAGVFTEMKSIILMLQDMHIPAG